MKHTKLLFFLSFCLLTIWQTKAQAQTLDYSFVVVGCNRVDYLDTASTTGTFDATGRSTANVYQLRRLFREVADSIVPKPKYLLLTGDVVMGYVNDTVALATQLKAWKSIYYNSPIANSGVKVIVMPGNHETQDKSAGKKSYAAAERTFVREMDSFIVGHNGPGIGGLDSLPTDQSKLTYSFDNGCDHFIILNTDPVGRDAIVPFNWIANDIKNARNNGARHIFSFGHKPAYSSYLKPGDGLEANVRTRDSFWKYMEQYNAEAMFSAHEHIWDTIHPHVGKTWQVIAGNGGSLVETTWMGSGQAYFGYTLVNVYTNNQVGVKSYGRNSDMTKYSLPQDTNKTTVRANFNIGISPVIDHTPLGNQTTAGPFTITATITDDIKVTGAMLNYKVDGVSQTPLMPTVSGNTYTFTIPAQTKASATITYNIQANDTSGILFYSTGCATGTHSFNYMTTDVAKVNSNMSNVNLYPNPTSGMATVAMTLKSEQNVSLNIMDIQGNIVMTNNYNHMKAGEQKISFNTESLATGTYSVQIICGTDVMTKKLTIIR